MPRRLAPKLGVFDFSLLGLFFYAFLKNVSREGGGAVKAGRGHGGRVRQALKSIVVQALRSRSGRVDETLRIAANKDRVPRAAATLKHHPL